MKRITLFLAFLMICLVLGALYYNNKAGDRMIMVNNMIYRTEGETGPMGDSECVEGHIKSSVDSKKTPKENEQSNFGAIGNPYTRDFGDDMIMVLVDEDWYIFNKVE